MKTYLSIERASQLSGLDLDQLQLLCEAGRLVSKQGDDTWFIAEDELVETLAAMNREVVLSEVEELAKAKRQGLHAHSTESRSAGLRQAASGVLGILLVALAVAGFSSRLTAPGGERVVAGARVAYQQAGKSVAVPLSSRQVASLAWVGWRSKLEAGLAEAGTRLEANLRALILP